MKKQNQRGTRSVG